MSIKNIRYISDFLKCIDHTTYEIKGFVAKAFATDFENIKRKAQLTTLLKDGNRVKTLLGFEFNHNRMFLYERNDVANMTTCYKISLRYPHPFGDTMLIPTTTGYSIPSLLWELQYNEGSVQPIRAGSTRTVAAWEWRSIGLILSDFDPSIEPTFRYHVLLPHDHALPESSVIPVTITIHRT